LGLAICKQLVEMMGGEIGVRSCLGVGSTFWFAVPLEKQLQVESLIPELAGAKLLVVSGSSLTRATVRSLAQTWGARCEEAETADGALSWLEQNANRGIYQHSDNREKCCDGVLIDLQMPQFDAVEFEEKVRSLSAIGPLLAMTSLREQPKAEALCSQGFSGYLVKPVRASRLREALLWAVKGQGEFGRTKGDRTCGLPRGHSQSLNPTNSQSSLKILLAEDHPINQQVIVAQLGVLGYHVDCAANGQEALDLLAAKSYDLVLMDCQMPVLDGYETTQKLREIEKGDRHTFVIALTAHAMPGEREKCLTAGMDDYLSKPVDLEALSAALKKYERENMQSENKYEVKTINLERTSKLATNYTEVLEKAGNSTVPVQRAIALQTWVHGDCGGLLDKNRLEQLGRVNINLPQRLLQAFVGNAQADLATAKIALEAKDWQTVEYQAHRLKGTCANVGVPIMADLAAELEFQAIGFQSEPPATQLLTIEGIENILVNLSSHLTRVREFVETRMFG